MQLRTAAGNNELIAEAEADAAKFIAAAEARSSDDFARALLTLSLHGPLSDPLTVEKVLLCRYACALRLIERFFSSASSEIILWLRSKLNVSDFAVPGW